MTSPDRARLAIIGALVATLLAAAPAHAQTCEAPPGTGAIDQYCETIPGAKGDRSSLGGGQGREPAAGRSTDQALADAGRDGRAVLALPGGAPPGGPPPERASQSPEGRSGDAAARKQPSDNPLDAIASSIGSGPTVGGWFLWLLIASGLAMAALAWIRYRRSPRS